jgi:hypothetical protein
MTQDKRGWSALIVAKKGMHVRATDTDGLDFYQHLPVAGYGIWSILKRKLLWTSVNERFHFAV